MKKTRHKSASGKKRYSYIREPFCRDGWYCFGMGLAAAVLTAVIAVCSVKDNGNVSLFMAAVGLSAVIIDIAGWIFVVSALTERHRNHLFTFIGAALLAAVLIAWGLMLMLGSGLI